jgi:hypothetical protein
VRCDDRWRLETAGFCVFILATMRAPACVCVVCVGGVGCGVSCLGTLERGNSGTDSLSYSFQILPGS